MTVQDVRDAVAQARRVPKPKEPAPDRPRRSYDAGDLVELDMPEPQYVCRPWVSEGVTLVVGRPKVGKTTLLRQLSYHANNKGQFLGETCARADVLFLSLEEGERVMRKKLAALGAKPAQLRGIRLEFEWPQGAAGVEQLRQWLSGRDSALTPLVIIDSLTRFRIPPSERGHQFTEDYNTVKLLADLAKEFPGLVVLLLHHTTKASPDDPVSAISGTYGLTAAADNFLIILKQGQQYRLHAGGRLWDRENSDFELRREAGGWALAGDWDTTAPQGLAPKQQQVITALKAGAKTNKTLAEVTGQTPSALSHMLGQLAARGLINRMANGWELSR
jgi:RecA-family ATPase